MQENSGSIEVKNFNLVFEKLVEAKFEHGIELNEDINLSTETAKTIILFREFQESTLLKSYFVLTKG